MKEEYYTPELEDIRMKLYYILTRIDYENPGKLKGVMYENSDALIEDSLKSVISSLELYIDKIK